MAAVVLPTPAGPYMNSLRRFSTASGFLARNIVQLLRQSLARRAIRFDEFVWRSDPNRGLSPTAAACCMLGKYTPNQDRTSSEKSRNIKQCVMVETADGRRVYGTVMLSKSGV